MFLNSGTCWPKVPELAYLSLRREEGDGVIPPVVGQAFGQQIAIGHELMHRQQFHRGDAQVLEVV